MDGRAGAERAIRPIRDMRPRGNGTCFPMATNQLDTRWAARRERRRSTR
jgi:hypothetical protein